VKSAPATSLTVAQLQREALWKRDASEIHFDVCRTRMADRFCQRCEDLDIDASGAERAYLEASRG
jgi:hypothetical protein